MTDMLKKVETVLDMAEAAGMFEARKRIKQGTPISEDEFKYAFLALREAMKDNIIGIRPDVWGYAMVCIAEGIKSLKLKGKECNSPLEQSPISPTTSS